MDLSLYGQVRLPVSIDKSETPRNADAWSTDGTFASSRSIPVSSWANTIFFETALRKIGLIELTEELQIKC
jgi:hypothetical protein